MRSMPLTLLAAVTIALLAWTGRAAAHPVGVSQGEYLYRDAKIYAGLTFARRELAAAIPWLRGDDGAESVLAFEEHRQLLGDWLGTRLVVSANDAPCSGTA